MSQLHFSPNERFDQFLDALKNQSPREWAWLIGKFRNRLMPVLMSRAKNLSSSALMSQSEFAEEVFEECLLKFYELFDTREFNRYEDMEAVIVRISDFKLKEGFAKVKRDQRLYFMSAEALSIHREKHLGGMDEEERKKAALIAEIYDQLEALPKEDADLILRFYAGEELQDIADDLNISPSACRKRKQRVLDKLKSMVRNTAPLLLLMLNEF